MEPVRVLVVDDSALMRRIITDILQSDPDIQVVATARNGKDALDMLQRHQVDVVTLDIEMPVMTGMEVLPKILELHRLPVIILSSLTTAGANHTIQALELGAFDFIAKPSGSISLDLAKVSTELIGKVKAAANRRKDFQVKKTIPAFMNPVTHLGAPVRTAYANTSAAGKVTRIVAIGTSTGGPRALQTVLGGLPGDLNAAVVVVQHMPPGFTKSLANRLDQICSVRVHEAEHGQELETGHVYIAPGDYHMQVESSGGRFVVKLDKTPPVGGHRPAVNNLFRSVAALQGVALQAVILTGMGNDGAEGLKLIKQAGGKTISEAKETCVVYGMPKAAAETGCVDAVVPLHEVSKQIVSFLKN
ncbi:protein-glutamate methylesterase/protein-glutamine glutaminase [Effusibacillus lacus]|uniref:Protein-glutamate methylesterase/protein-glutamine glutaminase n=1 Tax=Effusibacillus lacus TaxID=1348429 RepID=A0A292YP49_9BACL|nr:chemotaxis response regulator protein-glutamate methylesterase [Effusibacillus lacus]TCS73139.1 two-component system chemotaxis response regulator CheB [Effusibacillus lacus]GAX90543.1 chemotaxis response regulator protein-glutamate methylesterase [Effusibacillus lacus]